ADLGDVAQDRAEAESEQEDLHLHQPLAVLARVGHLRVSWSSGRRHLPGQVGERAVRRHAGNLPDLAPQEVLLGAVEKALRGRVAVGDPPAGVDAEEPVAEALYDLACTIRCLSPTHATARE